MNRSMGAAPSTNQASPLITYIPATTSSVARTGGPREPDTAASGRGNSPSRDSANTNRAALTAHASAQPKALIAAPTVIRSPIHGATYWPPRSPSSDGDLVNAAIPASSAPKPITSMAVTNTKYTPPKIAVPRMARGIERRGSRASSPRVAAASNPANDRNPNTTPRKTADASVPGATLNTDRSTVCPPGAIPPASLTSTITDTTRISVTVRPSIVSSARVPPRTGATASASTPSSAIAATANPAHGGWFGHTPRLSSAAAPKMPAAVEVTTP